MDVAAGQINRNVGCRLVQGDTAECLRRILFKSGFNEAPLMGLRRL